MSTSGMSTSSMSTSGMITNAADTCTSSSSKFFSCTYPRSIEAAKVKLQKKLLSRDRGASFSSKSEMGEWIMNELGGHPSIGASVKGEKYYMYTSPFNTTVTWRHFRFIAPFLDIKTYISVARENLQGTCLAALK